MKIGSLWIICVALAVQFLGVLAVPAVAAPAESPRLPVVSTAGDDVVKIIDPDFTPGFPNRAPSTLGRAIELQAANGR